jgi:transcriptional regulator GlxA family with amidase domain
MSTSIDVLLFDGFDELDAIAPFEVFQNAALAGADCEVSLVSLDGQDRVTASHGLDVGVDGQLADPEDAHAPDLLLVPGGGWSSGENRGVRREYDAGDIPEAVAAHYEAGTTIASVCTGAMLLERAGILGDGPAITHQSAVADLREAGVEVPDRRLVDTGQIATAGGVTSGLDLALYLVGREFGEAIAEDVAAVMEYEPSDDILISRTA